MIYSWGDFDTWAMDEDVEYRTFVFNLGDLVVHGKITGIIEVPGDLLLKISDTRSDRDYYWQLSKITFEAEREEDEDYEDDESE